MRTPTTRASILRRRQRGATMVSVMLLTVSLLTVGVLVVKSATRELDQSNALVSRERALLSAQAAADLASVELKQVAANSQLDLQLEGFFTNDCSAHPLTPGAAAVDCRPLDSATGAQTRSGVRSRALTNLSDCGGRPCMRPGTVVRLPIEATGAPADWWNIPMTTLVSGADPEARVTVWVRNNATEALTDVLATATAGCQEGNKGGSGSWCGDTDSRIVVTAMAELRGTVVTVEQEIAVGTTGRSLAPNQATADTQAGNRTNDNSAVNVCKDASNTAS